MKLKVAFSIVILFVTTLYSCSGVDTHSPNPVSNGAVDATPTIPRLTNTATPNISIDTLTITPTPAYAPQKCIEVKNEASPLNEGALILRTDKHFVLQNLKTSKIIQLESPVYSYGISPDHEKFAYIAGNHVNVVLADGAKINRFPASEKWQGVIAWLNTDKLLIEQKEWSPQDPGQLSPIIVLDIKAGTFESISPNEFPNIVFSTYKGLGPEWLGNLAFLPNSELSYVVYAAWMPGTQEQLIILWDKIQQKEIGRIKTLGRNDWESLPEWSRSGNFFITSSIPDGKNLPYATGGKELLLVQKDGVIKKLTNLTTAYKARERGYALSPDEDQVAFWLATDYQSNTKIEDQTWQLAILNLTSNTLSTYCIFGGRTPYPEKPIWSPDGNQLLLTSYNAYENNSDMRVSIFDTKNYKIFEISQNASGVGWLRSIP